MPLENATPSPRTNTTVSSLDASRRARRRWSSVRGRWSWPWPPGHQDLAQCCSAPKIPTLSSSCRWVFFGVVYTLFIQTISAVMLKSVSPPGSDRLFGCNEKSLSRYRQPPAHHQALLLTYLPPVRGRYPHRPELLHTSLLSPHA